MGQYYRPILLDGESKKIIATTDSWSFDNGAKLMEHSYLRNDFVNAVVNEIIKRGKEKQTVRLVWAGDYAEKADDFFVEQFKAGASAEDLEWFEKKVEEDKRINLYTIVRALVENEKIYRLTPQNTAKRNAFEAGYCFIANDTKKEYVHLWNVPNVDGWEVHPLPLLTCGYSANGKGGGDYEGTNMELVGSWCGDVISVHKPKDKYGHLPKKLEGYKEIKPDFAKSHNIMNDLQSKVKLLTALTPDEQTYYTDRLKKIVEDLNKVIEPAPKF